MRLAEPQITLIPWDPDSSEHVERLYQQRIACGWNKDAVEQWRVLQRKGKLALYWVALPDSDPSIASKLFLHTSAWPLEATSISDSTVSLGEKPRAPNPKRHFIPVGHICLESENKDPSLADPSKGMYRISCLYISTALQSAGLGRATMNEIESLAVSEPLNAKTLTLSTVANEDLGNKEKWDALRAEGRLEPKASLQDWYARRGYVPYEYKDKMWPQVDSQGRVWWTTVVFMRKEIQ